MNTVVVGTGYTGLRLLKQLPPEQGLGLSRSLPASVDERRVQVSNLDDDALSLALPADYSIVYTVPPATDADNDHRLERLLDNLDPLPQRFVYLSTTGVYGNRDGATVTETDPVNPETARARRRVAAETALGKWGASSGTEITILRVPGIYGPDRLTIERIRDRAPLIRESDAAPGNRIHVDDLVSACLHALDPDRPAGTYNLGDGDTRSSTAFANTVAEQLGWPKPPTISRAEADETFSPQRLSFLRESRLIDTTRMREILRLKPRYANADDGIRESLREMKLI